MTHPVGPALARVPEPEARERLHRYLSTVARGLPGPTGYRQDILCELGDGLLECYQTRLDQGEPPAQAARSATDEFGDPRMLAAQFAGNLAGRAAYRIAVGLLVTGPMVGALWVAGFASRTGLDWQDQASAMTSAVPVLGALLAVVVPAAMVAAGGAGRTAYRLSLSRALPRLSPRGLTTAVLIALVGCLAADASMLVGLVGASWTPTIGLAATASLLRFTLVAVCSRRIVALRAAAG